MTSDLEAQISERRKRLADLEKERSKLLDELLHDVDVLAAKKSKFRKADQQILTTKPNEPKPLNISRTWASILKRLSGFKNFNASEVMLVARALRNEEENEEKKMRLQTPGNIRSQLSLLTKREIIKRLGGGNYRVTEQTKKALKDSGD